MQLEADQPRHRSALHVVIQADRGDVSVHDVDERVAAGDEVELIPFARLEERLQHLGALEAADLPLGSVLGDVGNRAALGEEAAARLLVQLARILVVEIQIHLIAAEAPRVTGGSVRLALVRGQHLAAVLDAAVGRVHLDLDFQLEVSRRSAFPDQERIRSDGFLGRAFPDHDAVLDAPELRIAVPVLEERRLRAAAEAAAATAGRRGLAGRRGGLGFLRLFRGSRGSRVRTGSGARRQALAVEDVLEAGPILERDRRDNRAAASAAAATGRSARRLLTTLRRAGGRLCGSLRRLRAAPIVDTAPTATAAVNATASILFICSPYVPRGFAPRTPLHALSRAASAARSVAWLAHCVRSRASFSRGSPRTPATSLSRRSNRWLRIAEADVFTTAPHLLFRPALRPD